jgi:Protein of unknown function (DUF1800)
VPKPSTLLKVKKNIVYRMNTLEKNRLLALRAAFGMSLEDFKDPDNIEQHVARLFPLEPPGSLEVISEPEWQESMVAIKSETDDAAKQAMKKDLRERTKDLNLLWLQAMVTTNYPLLEKTALFWHGHFATRINNPYYDQQLLNIIRKNALGNFGDLLKAISKSAAMLQFLNNQQNKKQHPNENFAREVMELFTLGRGNYTENDIKEGARAFTGWAHDADGNFVFKKNQHDEGAKTFLGKTGNLDGDDIINILLEQKQTALFVTRKVYRYFVTDDHADEQRVKDLAEHFYSTNYDIGGLLKKIFTSDWFYSDKVAGAKIKSPIELLVGYQRMMPMQFENDKTLLNLQRALGQYLFEPPNVAGWPGGTAWIDSSSLVTRMRLPEALFASGDLNLSVKEPDGEHQMASNMVSAGSQPSKPFKVGRADVNWKDYIAFWKQYPTDQLPYELSKYLLPVSVSEQTLSDIREFADNRTHDDYIKSLTILFMQLPEYQLT